MKFWKKIRFQISLFFFKKSIIFQSCLIKSLLSIIKHHKNIPFQISLFLKKKQLHNFPKFFHKISNPYNKNPQKFIFFFYKYIGKIENKMSKRL